MLENGTRGSNITLFRLPLVVASHTCGNIKMLTIYGILSTSYLNCEPGIISPQPRLTLRVVKVTMNSSTVFFLVYLQLVWNRVLVGS